jgi:hypothetical protein
VVIAASGLIGAVALAWVVWAAWLQSTPQVQSSLRSFDVVDTHTVRASVAVKVHSAKVRATCEVQATATDHSVVGDLTFTVHGQSGTTNHTVTLRTERAAAAVQIVGCTAPGQKQPR